MGDHGYLDSTYRSTTAADLPHFAHAYASTSHAVVRASTNAVASGSGLSHPHLPSTSISRPQVQERPLFRPPSSAASALASRKNSPAPAVEEPPRAKKRRKVEGRVSLHCARRGRGGVRMGDIPWHLDRHNASLTAICNTQPVSTSTSAFFPSSHPLHLLDCAASLLTLGATSAMISRYHLRLLSCGTIVATADAALRNRFSVHPGQPVRLRSSADPDSVVEVLDKRPWLIHLGQRVVLDPDDKDGERFLGELVEEALDSQAGFDPCAPADDLERKVPRWVTVVEEDFEAVQEDEDDSADEDGGAVSPAPTKRLSAWVTRLVEPDEEFSDDSANEAELERIEGYDVDDPLIDDPPEEEEEQREEPVKLGTGRKSSSLSWLLGGTYEAVANVWSAAPPVGKWRPDWPVQDPDLDAVDLDGVDGECTPLYGGDDPWCDGGNNDPDGDHINLGEETELWISKEMSDEIWRREEERQGKRWCELIKR